MTESAPVDAPLEAVQREPAARASIGARLRAQRELLGWSLRDTAGRVGLSPSLISQIERDKVNPSVSTLNALVSELGLTMGDLFADTPASPAAVRPGAPTGPIGLPGGRSRMTLESGVTWERLTNGTDSLVEFLQLTYPPGSESCAVDAMMRHSGKEYGYVISGRLGVRIGFDEYELGPGASISFDASAPHRLWAIGDRPAQAVWVVVGRQTESQLG